MKYWVDSDCIYLTIIPKSNPALPHFLFWIGLTSEIFYSHWESFGYISGMYLKYLLHTLDTRMFGRSAPFIKPLGGTLPYPVSLCTMSTSFCIVVFHCYIRWGPYWMVSDQMSVDWVMRSCILAPFTYLAALLFSPTPNYTLLKSYYQI